MLRAVRPFALAVIVQHDPRHIVNSAAKCVVRDKLIADIV